MLARRLPSRLAGGVVEGDAGPIAGSWSGEGDDLLLLHGGPGLSDYMDLVEGETAGWRTIRYQQRGLSPLTVEGPFSVERHVADAVAAALRDGCLHTVEPLPMSMFDHVYAEPHSLIDEERAQFATYLADLDQVH